MSPLCHCAADGPDSRLPGTPTFHLIVVMDAIHDMTAPQEMLGVSVAYMGRHRWLRGITQ